MKNLTITNTTVGVNQMGFDGLEFTPMMSRHSVKCEKKRNNKKKFMNFLDEVRFAILGK